MDHVLEALAIGFVIVGATVSLAAVILLALAIVDLVMDWGNIVIPAIS